MNEKRASGNWWAAFSVGAKGIIYDMCYHWRCLMTCENFLDSVGDRIVLKVRGFAVISSKISLFYGCIALR